MPTTQHNIPEDANVQQHTHCQNLKYCIKFTFLLHRFLVMQQCSYNYFIFVKNLSHTDSICVTFVLRWHVLHFFKITIYHVIK